MVEALRRYTIEHVKSPEQLHEVYVFADAILDMQRIYPLEFYEAHFAQTPQLLIVACCAGRTCGCVFGSVEGDHILVSAVAVAGEARRMGVGSAMMREVEAQAVALDRHTLILAAREEAEPFYLSCGYRPNLFVQLPEGYAVARLKALQDTYGFVWEWEDSGASKLMLGLPQIDRPLQRRYEQAFPLCHTQVVFTKQV